VFRGLWGITVVRGMQNISVQITALLAHGGVFLASDLLLLLSRLRKYHVENTELQYGLNSSDVILHGAVLLHGTEFLGSEPPSLL